MLRKIQIFLEQDKFCAQIFALKSLDAIFAWRQKGKTLILTRNKQQPRQKQVYWALVFYFRVSLVFSQVFFIFMKILIKRSTSKQTRRMTKKHIFSSFNISLKMSLWSRKQGCEFCDVLFHIIFPFCVYFLLRFGDESLTL